MESHRHRSLASVYVTYRIDSRKLMKLNVFDLITLAELLFMEVMPTCAFTSICALYSYLCQRRMFSNFLSLASQEGKKYNILM